MEWPADGLGDGIALAAFLRGEGFRLSVGDDLRLAELRQRLLEQEIFPADGREAARWFGPVLCRNPDQRERLPDLLDQWMERSRLERSRLAPAPAVELTAPVEDCNAGQASPATRRRPWIWLVLAALLLAGGITYFLASFQGAEFAAPAVEAITQPTPDLPPWWSGLLTDLEVRLAKGGAMILPLAAAVAYLWMRRRCRTAVLRGMAPRDAPRAALALSVRDQPLFRPAMVRTALRDLRRHRMVASDEVDGRASLRATVAGAGFVRLVKAHRPVTPDYLLLVDRVRQDDHLALLAELLVDRLSTEQIHVTRYDYRGDPRILRRIERDGRAEAMTDLETLRETCRDHRLLLLTDAANFADPATGTERVWVEHLRRWEVSAIVTPSPQGTWGPRERALMRQGFLVVEASPTGLRDLAGQVRSDLPVDRATPAGPEPLALDRRLARSPFNWTSDRAPSDADIAALVADLRAALGAEGMQYLAALAVFPAVHPKLTLLVGNAVRDGAGRSLLTEDRLASLCRLPWLRRGRLPDWLRLALVRDLQTQPERAAAVRDAWTALLEPVPEGERDTLHFPVVPRRDPGIRTVINELVRRGQAPDLEEAILLRFLNDLPVEELGMAMPDRIPAEAGPRLSPREAGLLAAVSLTSAALAWNPGALVDGIAGLVDRMPEAATTTWVLGLILLTMLTSSLRGVLGTAPRWIVWTQWSSVIASCVLACLGLFADGRDSGPIFVSAATSSSLLFFGNTERAASFFGFLRWFIDERYPFLLNLVIVPIIIITGSLFAVIFYAYGDKSTISGVAAIGLAAILISAIYIFIIGIGCPFPMHGMYGLPIAISLISMMSWSYSSSEIKHLYSGDSSDLVQLGYFAFFVILFSLSSKTTLQSISSHIWDFMSRLSKCYVISLLFLAFLIVYGKFYNANWDTFLILSIVLLFNFYLYIFMPNKMGKKYIFLYISTSMIIVFFLVIAHFYTVMYLTNSDITVTSAIFIAKNTGVINLKISRNDTFILAIAFGVSTIWVFPIIAIASMRRLLTLYERQDPKTLTSCVKYHKLPSICFLSILLGIVVKIDDSSMLNFSHFVLGLSIWIASTHAWSQAARTIALAVPFFLIDTQVGPVASVFEPGLLVTAFLLMRLVADSDFRNSCRTADSLSWRAWAFLLLPMGLGVTVSLGPFLSLGWSPGPLAVFLFGLVGFSALPLVVPLRVVGAGVALSVVAALAVPVGPTAELPWLQMSLLWLPLTPAWGVAAVAGLLCGRAIRDALDAGPAELHGSWGFPTMMVALFLLPNLVLPLGAAGQAVSAGTRTMLLMPGFGMAALAGLRYGSAGVRTVLGVALGSTAFLLITLDKRGILDDPLVLFFGSGPSAASLTEATGIGFAYPGLIALSVNGLAALWLAALAAGWRRKAAPSVAGAPA